MNIRPQDLTEEERALVDQLALREFDRAETSRTARACYEGCLAFIEARRAFFAPVEQSEWTGNVECPDCGRLVNDWHCGGPNHVYAKVSSVSPVEQPERTDVGMQCLGCGDTSRPCRCEGYSTAQPKQEESEHDRLIRAADDCAAAGEHKAAQRFREMAKGLERPEPKVEEDGDSCWLGDSCPECKRPEPERKFPVGKCVFCGELVAPYNAHAKYGGGYTCMDRPKAESATVTEGELPEAVENAVNNINAWAAQYGLKSEAKAAFEIADALETWARSLPKAEAVPVEATVTVGLWQLEELLKYADLAEVALRTGFHPPEFLFQPADRSLRQCIDAIKDQRDRWLAGLEGK